MHEDDHDVSQPLQSLLDEAASAEPRVSVDSVAFLSRLQHRIRRRQRHWKAASAAAAALLVIALLWQSSLPSGNPGPSSENSLVMNPGPELLEQLDVLELLSDFDPEMVAVLASSHIDTVEGFDIALAELPLELLVKPDEEDQ